jgi:hypothetical protein
MSAAQLVRLLRDDFPPGAALEACTLGSGAENLGAVQVAASMLQQLTLRAGGEAVTASAAAAVDLAGAGATLPAPCAQQDTALVVDFFPFAALPPALTLKILAALPADIRLRCAEVCRGWREMVAERSLWTRLDLSHTSGVTHCVTDALLRAAAAKACGALTALDISGCEQLTYDALLAVVTANASALRELLASGDFLAVEGDHMYRGHLEALLRAAPHLQVLDADLHGFLPYVLACLRNEGIFAPLRLRRLTVNAEYEAAVAVIELARGLGGHTSLTRLVLDDAAFEDVAAMDAVVDAALAQRLHIVHFRDCNFSPASAPSLARLLRSSALRELYIDDSQHAEQPLLDEPAAVLLANALRRNTTLEILRIVHAGLWADRGAAAALLSGLVAHPSVRDLALVHEGDSVEGDDDAATAGLLLSALLVANAPALTQFSVSKCGLGDAGLAPLLHALQRNTHLTELGCWGNGVSEAFVREQLMPAVRARRGLLLTTSRGTLWDSACDAEEDMVRDLCFLWQPEQ